MAKREKQQIKSAKKLTGNAKYLDAMFILFKKRENIVLSDSKNKFNDTELRLLGEVFAAKQEGRRLISTQLATLLGITRSAISQIVQRLEEKKIIKRVGDAVDRKIAYIEISDEIVEQYQRELRLCANFAGKVVKKYGVEKFEELCKNFEELVKLIEEEQKELHAKK